MHDESSVSVEAQINDILTQGTAAFEVIVDDQSVCAVPLARNALTLVNTLHNIKDDTSRVCKVALWERVDGNPRAMCFIYDDDQQGKASDVAELLQPADERSDFDVACDELEREQQQYFVERVNAGQITKYVRKDPYTASMYTLYQFHTPDVLLRRMMNALVADGQDAGSVRDFRFYNSGATVLIEFQS